MGFFLTDPVSLFSCDLVPNETQTRDEKYNTIMRLILIFALLMFILKWKYTLLFLLISMFMIITIYYSSSDNDNDNVIKKENFTVDYSKFNNNNYNKMQSTTTHQQQHPYHNQQNQKHNYFSGPNGNLLNANLTALEKIKKYSNDCQGYPLFNKPLFIPNKLFDLDAASGYDPNLVFGKMNSQPTQELNPQDKDFPNVINPLGRRQPVQYLDDNVNANAVLSNGALSRQDLNNLFKNNDYIITSQNIEPANMPDCNNQYKFLEDDNIETNDKESYCSSCETEFNSKSNWCPQCGMSSFNINNKNNCAQLQRVQTLPEWKNQNFKNARSFNNTTNSLSQKYKDQDIGGFNLDGATFFDNDVNPLLNKNNYTPYMDGGLGVDPNDNSKIINRTNPSMFYRKGTLQESQYPKLHEFNDFEDVGVYVFNRYDPQAIRDIDTLDAGRAEEMPLRNQFSKKMSRYEAPSHTTPIDKIDGNPEIDMYRVGYNTMKDCSGNIKYQVPESAYQYPLFSKSKVDHIAFLNPMYQTMNDQRRVNTLSEARASAETQWMNDSLNVRENLIESYLSKTEARRLQQKIAPHSSSKGSYRF